MIPLLAGGGPVDLLTPMHGVASRHDLPLPFEFVLAGAAVVLVVSFVLLFFGWPERRYHRREGRALGRVPGWVVTVGRILVLLWYAVAAAALVAGDDGESNPVVRFVFVLIWVGLVPVSVLFGPIWKALNPLRTLHGWLAALLRVDPAAGLVRLPAGIGVWPGALGLFGFAFLELVQPANTTLPVLRLWVAVWFVVLIVGAAVFGSDWIAAADPFEVFASAVAAGSWLHSTADGRLLALNPLAALATYRPPPGLAAVVAALLGSTAFDSFANTSFWVSTVRNSATAYELWATAGLVALVAVVGLSFWAAARLMAPGVRRGVLARQLARLMAPSVIPIVVGYAVAHYATLLIVEGQRGLLDFLDPLGLGWNAALVGADPDTRLVEMTTLVAVIQLLAIIGGHVVGIVIAHERALALLRRESKVVGQLPMLILMVGYTCAGLVLLFQP